MDISGDFLAFGLMVITLFIPSFLVIWLGAFVTSKIRGSAYSKKNIAISVAIAVAIQVAIAAIMTLSSHRGDGYYVCTIDWCGVQPLGQAFGSELGGIWFINIVTLTAPTFGLSLLAYAALGSVSSTRVRLQKIG